MLQQLSVGLIFFGAMLINAITGFAGNLLAMPGTIQLIGMTDAKVVFKNHAVYDPWDR